MRCTLLPSITEDCRWNNIWEMARCLVFYQFRQNLTLTFTFGQGHRLLGHWMRLIGLYHGTKYEVCWWNSLRDMTSSLVFYPFLTKFDLWPWPKVMVISTWVIECALLGCTLVPSMKSVGEIVSEIWPVLWFLYTSTKSWRGYIFTAVCLCVCLCVSVCPALLVNKIPAERMHLFGFC